MNLIPRISFSLFFCSALVLSCKKDTQQPDYRGEMRKFVEKISSQAKAQRPGFIVIPQNGLALLSNDGTASGNPDPAYIQAIDGVGQEELWYGYDNKDNELTPETEHTELLSMCLFAHNQGLKVLATDYCASADKINASYTQNAQSGFISFAADHRDLDDIPSFPPYHSNTDTMHSLADVKNYLYLISPGQYTSKEEFIHAIEQTNYDAVIMDLFFDESTMFNSSDLARLHAKPGGGTRKLICYMSIGEAESYRWYWKPFWKVTPPVFLVAEDPDWLDNYSVRYWDPNWQNIICGSGDSYLNRIVNAGFDGVYLDLVSEYEYFEEGRKQP